MKAENNVGPGWAPIAQRAMDQLEAMGVGILQVKEKWGGLRIYTNNTDVERHDEVDLIIETAASECEVTCEECGNPGTFREDLSWMKTLCDEHYAAQKREK
jgi:hypothetical protein